MTVRNRPVLVAAIAAEIAGGNCIPAAVSSSAFQAASVPPAIFGIGERVSGGILPVVSPFEISSDASPAVLRSSQAICLIASNWSIVASW